MAICLVERGRGGKIQEMHVSTPTTPLTKRVEIQQRVTRARIVDKLLDFSELEGPLWIRWTRFESWRGNWPWSRASHDASMW